MMLNYYCMHICTVHISHAKLAHQYCFMGCSPKFEYHPTEDLHESRPRVPPQAQVSYAYLNKSLNKYTHTGCARGIILYCTCRPIKRLQVQYSIKIDIDDTGG
jgi:hypothetical protein